MCTCKCSALYIGLQNQNLKGRLDGYSNVYVQFVSTILFLKFGGKIYYEFFGDNAGNNYIAYHVRKLLILTSSN